VSAVFLGIDVGTSAVKAVLVDESHALRAQANARAELVEGS